MLRIQNMLYLLHIHVHQKVPLTIKYNSDYRIRVKATGGLHFDKTVTRISVSWKASSIFIQTDKAAYKPGDLGKNSITL